MCKAEECETLGVNMSAARGMRQPHQAGVLSQTAGHLLVSPGPSALNVTHPPGIYKCFSQMCSTWKEQWNNCFEDEKPLEHAKYPHYWHGECVAEQRHRLPVCH